MHPKRTYKYKHLTLSLLAGLSFTISQPVFAETSDTKLPETIRLVVPFTPGGSNDVFARAVADGLRKSLDRTIIVENKPGAGGSIGTNEVSNAKADGGTLLVSSTSFVTRAAVDQKLPYNARTSFAPVAMIARGPMLLVSNKDVPYKTVPELLKAAQSQEIDYGSAGIGAIGQLSMELLSELSDVDFMHIPYKGMSGAVTDLMGGRLDIMITTPASLGGTMDSGHLREMAVTSPKPSKFFPNLPAIAETVPGYEVEIYWGVFAPADTSEEIVNELNRAITTVTSTDDMKTLFASEAAEPDAMDATQFHKFIDNELTKWGDLAHEREIRLN